MALSDFTGMLKLTIRDNTAETPKFVVLGANQLGSDGLSISDSANEITIGTFAGDITLPNGIATSAGTATVIPLKTADMGKLFPQGWDETTKTWQMPIGGCDALDADVVLEGQRGQYFETEAIAQEVFAGNGRSCAVSDPNLEGAGDGAVIRGRIDVVGADGDGEIAG